MFYEMGAKSLAFCFEFAIIKKSIAKLVPRINRRGKKFKKDATVAQLVEQLIRNQQVAGSSPASSSRNNRYLS